MAFIQVPPNSTGEKIDIRQMSDGGGNNVDRQVVVVGDPSTYGNVAAIESADPGASDLGLVVREPRGSSTSNPKYVQIVHSSVASLTVVPVNVSASGNNTIVAASTGKVVRLWRALLTITGAANLIIQDGSSIALSGPMDLQANGSLFLPDPVGEAWYATSAGNALVFNLSAAATLAGTVWITQS